MNTIFSLIEFFFFLGGRVVIDGVQLIQLIEIVKRNVKRNNVMETLVCMKLACLFVVGFERANIFINCWFLIFQN